MGFYIRWLFLLLFLQEKCTERNKHIRIRYKPSLFQHVGIQSSFPGREQYFKVSNLKCSWVMYNVSWTYKIFRKEVMRIWEKIVWTQFISCRSICYEEQSSLQDPSYLTWLEKSSLCKLLCLIVPSCTIQIMRLKKEFWKL